MRYVAFLDVDANLLRQVAPFTTTCKGRDHATGKSKCEAGAHNQGRRRDGTGRIGFFARGERIRNHDTRCCYPAI